MRILQLAPHFYAGGGIQRHIVELAAWNRDQGHSVWLAGASGGWMNAEIDEQFLDLPLDRVSLLENADRRRNNIVTRLWFAMKSAVKTRRLIKGEKIQVVHAHETAAAFVARFATLGLKVPVIYTYHGSEFERTRQVGRVGRFCADAVIVLSHRAAGDLQRVGGIQKRKLNVIGLGIKPPPTVSEEEALEARKRLLNGKRYLAVSVARLCNQKGIDILIEVVKKVAETRSDIQFAVVGDGPLETEVNRWASAANVNEALTFVGYTEKPFTYLAAADAFLLTSRWEALPISIVEAFRMGLPVIACDTGGVSELVKDGVGYVAPVADVDEIAKAILTLFENDARRQEMANSALSWSQADRFDPAHINSLIEELYQRLASGEAPKNNGAMQYA